MTSTHATTTASSWPHRLALATWLSALPLVVFGGAVTTLRAGMSIDGWWVLDRGRGDYFLLAYPLDKWFASAGTFSEHTHRLCGVLVGLFAIAYMVAAAREHRRGAPISLALWGLGGFVAVSAQGTLGGLRVLENSPQLAFLHGCVAQIVFAVLGANVVLSSRAWREARATRLDTAPWKRASLIAVAAVYAQIVLGAWLRHTGAELPLMLHLVFAALAAGAVLMLARHARETGAPELVRSAQRLKWLLVAQLCAGGLATVAIFVVSGGFTASVSTAETFSSTLHVLLGALLLQQTVAAAMWMHRFGARESRVPVTASFGVGGAQ
jgi:cytochrome c oxidase assembly protein subunit 15